MEIKIIDLGLAYFTSNGAKVKRGGTPGFLAPEILDSEEKITGLFGLPSDLYAIGVVYYCIVSGEHPYDSEDCHGVIEKNKIGKIDFQIPSILNVSRMEQSLLKGMLALMRYDRSPIEHLFDTCQLLIDQIDRDQTECGGHLTLFGMKPIGKFDRSRASTFSL